MTRELGLVDVEEQPGTSIFQAQDGKISSRMALMEHRDNAVCSVSNKNSDLSHPARDSMPIHSPSPTISRNLDKIFYQTDELRDVCLDYVSVC
jgi:hypothetical protein